MRRFTWQTALANRIFISVIVLGWTTLAAAQVRPIADDTLGNESSRVIPLDPRTPGDRIEGGARRGDNLFHSFREFHVNQGRSVYFADPGVDNILTRVTGGVESRILGVLGVLGNANLFLINPGGIMFGPNARLDVRGSFVATTADAMQFGDQGFFSATNPTAPPLLTVQPTAFLFNQLNPAAIVNNSRIFTGVNPSGLPRLGLRVPEGESLTLLGGNISMNRGGLNALGGRVEVGGLSEPGTVTLNADGSLEFPTGIARSDVSLSNQAFIDVAADGGGSITVNADNFEILNGVLSAGIGSNSGSVAAQAGNITLNASAIRAGDRAITRNQVGVGGIGNAGDIRITTDSLSLTNGARLNANTLGQGNAGNVIIDARDRITLDNSAIFSSVGDVSFNGSVVGNGGDIRITTGSLSLTNGAVLVVSTIGQGNAGNVIISARDLVSLDGVDPINPRVRSAIFSTVGAVNTNRVAEGEGGDIRITTGSLSLTNTGQLSASTLSQGSAGNVIIDARDRVALDNGAIFSSVGIFNSNAFAVGNGGDIRITTGSLSLTNGSRLNASTLGQGNAGNVLITARDRVSLDGGIILSTVGPGNTNRVAEGEGGDIRISTGSLSLTNGAQLVTSTVAQGNAGNVIIDARDLVSLDGVDPSNPLFFSSILSTVGAGNVNRVAEGEGGDIRIGTASLSLTNGGRLSASTQGQGNAGNVIITARDRVSLVGVNRPGFPSEISTATLTSAQGRGGDVRIAADSVRIVDGAIVSTETRNRFLGGNVILNANAFEATGGGQVITATTRSGQAGSIILEVADQITLSGVNLNQPIRDQGGASGLYAGTARNSSGAGGTIQVTTGQLEVFDRARIAVNSQGAGIAGDIDITASRVQLENQARLIAETVATDGGNITLRDLDVLLLRNNSLISTTAGTDRAGGNGGNINIDADLIVAIPNEDSDIRANAFSGSGGNIRITTEGLFGIAAQLRDNPLTSDITASSQFGVQGTVDITPPDVDPRRGLPELPATVVDASSQIAQTCSNAGVGESESEFIVTGRGGLPASPIDSLVGDESLANWITLDEEAREVTSAIAPVNPESNPEARQDTDVAAAIVEAQEWIVADNGAVELIAAAPVNTAQTPATCQSQEDR